MTRIDDIAERYAAARDTGDFCPEWLPGALTLEEALAVQLNLLDRTLAAGKELAGWKVGLTSPRSRSALGADVRPFRFVLRENVIPSGGSLDTATMGRPAVEPELCFTFASGVSGANKTVDDI